MCGLAGFAVPRGSRRQCTEEQLRAMRDTLVHRGPDDAGMYRDDEVGLGHRRLSIVDLAHGHQPMTNARRSTVVAYNGEIFNHPQLQRTLEAEGVHYATHCDTETLLHLYDRMGEAFVEQCRGMFALALWDTSTRVLYLVRDRFGVKPLYYAHLDDGTLLFASEIKALLASGHLRAALHTPALPDYLANHAPSGEETLFAGIRRVPAGHILTWQDGRITLRRYWDLSFAPSGTAVGSDAAVVGEYRERLREAVRLRLMADVPLGAFLSGGIDSAAITALMAEQVGDGIKTFSVAFAERSANELVYARQVAQAFRTDHHEVVLSPDEFWTLLPRMIWHEDEPLAHPSSVALYAVARLAAEQVKVVLTGEGSDETLGGYNRYRVGRINAQIARVWSVLPAALRQRVAQVVGEPGGAGWRRVVSRTPIGRGTTLDGYYFDNEAVFTRGMQAQLLQTPALQQASQQVYATMRAHLSATDAPTLLGRLLYADTKSYLQELLMKQDQMSMAASIESRVPFLDHPLVEWVAALPDRFKIRGPTTKWILRAAMAETLPPSILSRKKMGFPVPVGPWLRSDWRALVSSFVLSPRALDRGLFSPAYLHQLVAAHDAHGTHGARLWSLINLELWMRMHLDGEDHTQLSAQMRPGRVHPAGREH